MNNGEYEGRRDKPKNYAIQQDISGLAGRIDGLVDVADDHETRLTTVEQLIQDLNIPDSQAVCFPADGSFASVEQPATDTQITITHPAMTCVEICVRDTVTGRFVSLGFNPVSTTQTQLIFAEAPADNRYQVQVKGIDAS